MRLNIIRWPAVVPILLCAALLPAVEQPPSNRAYEAQLHEARKNPRAVLERLDQPAAYGSDRRVLFMVLTTLGQENRISAATFLAVVNRGLVDVDDYVRGHVVHYLDDVYEGEELQRLYRRSTLDKSPLARHNAAECMRDFPSRESEIYLDALLGDESIEVRNMAAAILCHWHLRGESTDIKAVFVRDVQSDDIRRAGCAAQVLAEVFHLPPHLDVLNEYLKAELDDSSPYCAADSIRGIIRLLGAIGDASSRAVLDRAATHAVPSVAAEAREALSRLGASRKVESRGRTER